MRTALLLSGHLRTWPTCVTSVLDNIVKPLGADLFISTWDLLGFTDANKRPKGYEKRDGPTDPEAIHNAYGDCIKKLHVEHQDDSRFETVDKINTFSGRPNATYRSLLRQNSIAKVRRMRSMWYKVWDCNRLRLEYEQEQGFTYDQIIRARPDIVFYNGVPSITLSDSTVYIAKSERYGLWNDQFAFGNNGSMMVYCDLYNHIDRYVSENFPIYPWVEGLVKRHFAQFRIERKVSDVRYLLRRN